MYFPTQIHANPVRHQSNFNWQQIAEIFPHNVWLWLVRVHHLGKLFEIDKKKIRKIASSK